MVLQVVEKAFLVCKKSPIRCFIQGYGNSDVSKGMSSIDPVTNRPCVGLTQGV